ncbi:MAG: hypothetical protein WBB85_04295 [Albidovulum sp.]|uniref:hypothetical protein n=1 Tax=Albidovulum sp. TaxID=1872424 RepID=UPI003C8D5F68
MALSVALGLFTIFVANVAFGAILGAAFLGDVSEMLVLFAASIAFVASILRREAAAKVNYDN